MRCIERVLWWEPTEVLKKEHEDIKVMLNIFWEARLYNLRGNGKEQILSMLSKRRWIIVEVFAGKCHFGKKKNYFPGGCEKVGIPKDGGPLGAMIQESWFLPQQYERDENLLWEV